MSTLSTVLYTVFSSPPQAYEDAEVFLPGVVGIRQEEGQQVVVAGITDGRNDRNVRNIRSIRYCQILSEIVRYFQIYQIYRILSDISYISDIVR